MKKPFIIAYWTVTVLMSALVILSAIPDITRSATALGFFKHLGYPEYLLPFLGTLKILGVAAVLIPGYPRLKEWAYAGLIFDMSGALYSHLSVGDGADFFAPALIGLILSIGSYILYTFKVNVRPTAMH